MFADSGMKYLLEKLVSMGAQKKRMQVVITGGAEMSSGPQGFNIGKRNYLAIRKILWSNGMFIDTEDVGGSSPRNLYLYIADGTVVVRSDGRRRILHHRTCFQYAGPS
jgi:chemotaxis protein CheD